ncbi:MAG: hypothetical protein PHU59_00635 [Candidatus Omnitrophica bacterium]|nr:hypothetical protein [Candidatus Omnitrophota bacterium]
MQRRKKHNFKNRKAEKKVEKKVVNKVNSSTYLYKFGKNDFKLTVLKEEVPRLIDLPGTVFHSHCESCLKDFDAEVTNCSFCQKPLVKINLRRCQKCGAKNDLLKQSCWVCNTTFPSSGIITRNEIQTVLILEMNGEIYKSTNQLLSPSIKKLFEDLISSNFSKEAFQSWINRSGFEIEYRKEVNRSSAWHSHWEFTWQNMVHLALVVVLPLVIILLLISAFWMF